ncbi:LysR family transcriptional regulator [Roseovarius sp. CH_XMU1461]|uniref:LysR family transcriptional regulator n=1 Tax=Roseovarius sp. CH_XMU1461 TaxID=3107777 RepID=UPI003008AF93
MQDFTLRQLEYLLAAVDEGSVAGAAARLNVSQPTISVALAKMEAQLGVQLLLRQHAQGVTPTASARTILPAARSLLAHAGELGRAARDAGAGLAGELTIGAVSTLAPLVLPALIARLGRDYPELRLAVRDGSQAAMLAALEAGAVDMVLLYDIDLPESVASRVLAAPQPYALLPEGHRLAGQAEVRLRDLAAEPLILLDMPPSRDWFLGLFRAAGVEANVAHTSPSMELVRGMVGQGLGYSVLVTRPRHDRTYDGRRVVARPLSDSPTAGRVVIGHLRGHRQTRLMQVFAEAAAAHFAQEA